jgi:hypothetical protein
MDGDGDDDDDDDDVTHQISRQPFSSWKLRARSYGSLPAGVNAHGEGAPPNDNEADNWHDKVIPTPASLPTVITFGG